MMERAFITGITGFIGRPLARQLLELGYYVSGVARRPAQVEGCTVLTGDILNPESYAAEAERADLIIHLAAPTAASYIARNPLETMTVNMSGVTNLLNCFESGAGRHFLLLSTGKVYGRSQALPYGEEHPLNPVGALGKAKKAAEEMVLFFSENSSKSFSVLRLFNGYGPGQDGDFLVPTIIEQIPKGSIVLGDTAGRRDFIFIDDIIAGITSVLKNVPADGTFKIYNLGTGTSYSPADLVDFLAEVTGKNLTIVSDPSRLRRGEPDEERADTTRLQALGWKSDTDIKYGLAQTWRALMDAAGRPA